MLRTLTVIMALLLIPLASSAAAQGRGRARQGVARAQGIPPGQLPPAGMCRVWYQGQAPGRQPRPTSCQEAERIASRDRNARVIYSADMYDQLGRNGRYGNNRNGTYGSGPQTSPYPGNERGVPRVPGRNRAPSGSIDPYYSNQSRYGDTAYENGFRDGREKGIEDREDNDRADPTRHSRYRSADRGYIDTYGDKNRYKDAYREGFKAGYDNAYRSTTTRR